MQPPALPPLNPGDILAGKYRIESILGTGAMGIVFAARHIELQEIRAIKLMLPAALGDADGVERFLREARAAVRLRGRHIARVLDLGRTDDGAPFIVMEHLEGSDLRAVLERDGSLPVLDAVRYVAQACEGLAEAHAVGIVHRDLKPANLFLTREPNGAPCIKILDFGIAKISSAPDAPALEMTKTAEIIGTPMFMSPEQMRSTRDVDARTDVWSLGIILFRALTGQAPFKGTTITQLCAAVVADPPPRPSSLRAGLPHGLEEIVLRCLEKEPARRYASAAELGAALEAIAGVETGAHVVIRVPSLIDLPPMAAQGGQTTGKAGAWQQDNVPPAEAPQPSTMATLLVAGGAAFVLALGAAGAFALFNQHASVAPAAAPTSAPSVAGPVAPVVSASSVSPSVSAVVPSQPTATPSASVVAPVIASASRPKAPTAPPAVAKPDAFDTRK